MGRILRVGSLFSGIGGLELGLEMTGHFETVWQVEIDKYARKILAKHWPDVRRHDDVCTFPTDDCNWDCDVICGGFPCQDLSYAGKGAGLDGQRSGLFYELARVVREVGPRYVILENVAAMLNRGMGDVLGTMASLGYDIEWHCIPAASVGAPHIRDRVFILGCSDGLLRDKRKRSANLENSKSNGRQQRRPKFERQKRSVATNGTSREVADTNNVQRKRSIWAVEPNVGRVANGVPSRVDRLRCLGNAVVPQVAQVVGEILWSIHNGQYEPQQRQTRRA